uniref:Uncharacterized protein n=2 Tax=Rhizophagus irregularis TaxID=588596 RepID=U9U5Z9_RHIID
MLLAIMKLLENDEDCNVIIYVGENKNEKEIQTHSCILRIRSQYFRTAFSMNKKDGKFIEIILYSVSSPCGAFLALNRTSFRAINEVLATSANSILRQQDQGHKDVESQR